MDVWLLLILWLFLGFFNWCAVLGDLRMYPNQREDYGIAAFMGILGPFATIGLIFATNFFQHGFKLK